MQHTRRQMNERNKSEIKNAELLECRKQVSMEFQLIFLSVIKICFYAIIEYL